MTENTEPPISSDTAPPDAKRRTGIFPIALGVLNLLVSGSVLALVLLAPSPHAASADLESARAEDSLVSATLDPFVVNLDEPGSSRYLKTSLELEVRGVSAADRLEQRKREVRDELLSYLSGLTVADTQGEANKSRIRSELKERVDRIVGDDMVARLYFTDFVVQ